MRIYVFSVFVVTLLGFLKVTNALKVSVFYEALCPDSVRFIGSQLYPRYSEIADYVDLELVPYGKAFYSKSDGNYYFSCQHGPSECLANKYQSCALSLTNDSKTDVNFVNCVMRNRTPSQLNTIKSCATTTNIPWLELQECVSSGQGDELLAANGRRTDKFIPDLINYVPIVVINDVYNKQLDTLALNNFVATILFLSEQIECGFCHFNETYKVL